MKILVVDDNPIVQMALQRMLERNGHEVSAAADARQAARMADLEAFDCVVLDIGEHPASLWQRTGIEAARRIRASSGPSRRASLIGFTALDPAYIPEDERSLFAIILEKPIELERMGDRCCYPRPSQTYLS